MELFRRHLAAVIAFSLAIIFCVVAALIAGTWLDPSSARLIRWTVPLCPLAFFAIALVAVTLCFYRRADGRRRVEWWVLVAALAAALVLAQYGSIFLRYLVWPASREQPTAVVVASGVLNCALLVCLCILGSLIAAVWMTRQPPGDRSLRFRHELAAVAVLTLLSMGLRWVAWRTALAHEWGVGSTLWSSFTDLWKAELLRSGFAILAVLAAWLIIGLGLWRKATPVSRWGLAALITLWPALDAWFRMVGEWTFSIYPHDLSWGLLCGAAAGALAILYSRVVVVRRWCRAFGEAAGAGGPTTAFSGG